MKVEGFYEKAQKLAIGNFKELLAKPIAENVDWISAEGMFYPWELFPVYGSYCSEFDACALDVLRELRDRKKRRYDLGAEMFREMLCVMHLCDYGTAPRVCFPTEEFGALLPELIAKWESYAALSWGSIPVSDKAAP
jgi:hypothetical protein